MQEHQIDREEIFYPKIEGLGVASVPYQPKSATDKFSIS
jgi:hypothetical protein